MGGQVAPVLDLPRERPASHGERAAALQLGLRRQEIGKPLGLGEVDTAVGESKIGVPECDEVIDLINAEMNNPDDNFITKAAKQTILNRIKDGIRENVEQNKTNKGEMAKTCKEFKIQFDKYKAEHASQQAK